MNLRAIFGVVTLATAGAAACGAAEIEIKPQCRCESPLVTLGDLAVIRTNDRQKADELAKVELFASPPPGGMRTVRLRELRETIELRGVDLLGCHFAGASVIRVYGMTRVGTATGVKKINPALVLQREGLVKRAIQSHFLQNTQERATWEIDVRLDRQQAASIPSGAQLQVVEGIAHATAGTHSFVLTATTAQGVTRIPVTAHVTMPELVVVPTRPLQRGQRIRRSDVEMAPAPIGREPTDAFFDVEDVVDLETTRSLSTGQPIVQSQVRQPLLVRRNEFVTVFARAAGIQVRTTAKALLN